MNPKELEEYRYDVAVTILKNMSEGSRFQYAVDRQLQILAHYDEDKLNQLMRQHGPKDKTKKKTKGGGF